MIFILKARAQLPNTNLELSINLNATTNPLVSRGAIDIARLNKSGDTKLELEIWPDDFGPQVVRVPEVGYPSELGL